MGYERRKMRVGPCEEPRECPTRNRSKRTVSAPLAARAQAAEEPITPAPITTTSVRSMAAIVRGEQPEAGGPGATGGYACPRRRQGAWWAPRSSKPVKRLTALGGFDSRPP